MNDPIVLSDEEGAELYRFTRYSYINLNLYPNLMRLIDRVTGKHGETLQAAVRSRTT